MPVLKDGMQLALEWRLTELHFKDAAMVATSAWLTIEPEIGLKAYLASEEIEPAVAELSWMPASWLKECVAAEAELASTNIRS